jgi:hypothetical protein
MYDSGHSVAEYPNGPPHDRGVVFIWLFALVMVGLLGAMTLRAMLHHEKADDRERHSFNGVTWLGDDCRVLDDHVLICLVRQEA